MTKDTVILDKTFINTAKNKKNELIKLLNSYGKAAIAFSGGVDSTFLLKTAHDIEDLDVIAVTLDSPVFTEKEKEFAKQFCVDEGIDHQIIEIDLLDDNDFTSNPKNRCYICKKKLFGQALELVEKSNISCICDGSTADDENDYRPGETAIKELGIKSPMREVRLTKDEIRFLSKELGLPTWEKPSMACLASRIPYGKKITEKKLRMIENAENYLTGLGFTQIRVRVHDDVARLEVLPEDMGKISSPVLRERIYEELSRMGFSYVSLDLRGYRTGSMNESIL